MQAGVLRRHSLRHAALARPTALWNTRAATTSPNQACRLTTAQLHVNSTSPQIAAGGLANARTLAAERRRCRGRRRSGGAGERFELVARVAGGDLPEVDEHDRASSVQLVYRARDSVVAERSEEHTSELQSHSDLVCRLLLEKKKKKIKNQIRKKKKKKKKIIIKK